MVLVTIVRGSVLLLHMSLSRDNSHKKSYLSPLYTEELYRIEAVPFVYEGVI